MPLIWTGGAFTRTAEGRTYVIASNSDIAPDISAGFADFALLGSDKYNEINPDGLNFESVGKLPCRFVLALPEGQRLEGAAPLRAATSYPNALARFAVQSGLNIEVGPVRHGAVEGAIGQGIADAVFDICETGSTLAANNLYIAAEGDPLELGGLWRARRQI
jgi:ATP phosphoribosyltransferase